MIIRLGMPASGRLSFRSVRPVQRDPARRRWRRRRRRRRRRRDRARAAL